VGVDPVGRQARVLAVDPGRDRFLHAAARHAEVVARAVARVPGDSKLSG
jgi:hypothetical protein